MVMLSLSIQNLMKMNNLMTMKFSQLLHMLWKLHLVASFLAILFLQLNQFKSLRSNHNLMESPSRLVRFLALSLNLAVKLLMMTILNLTFRKKTRN